MGLQHVKVVMLHYTETYHSGIKCVNIAPTVMKDTQLVIRDRKLGEQCPWKKLFDFKGKEERK